MSTRLLSMTAWAVFSTCLSGCSLLISQSGTTLRDLDSRQIVQDRFGKPDAVSLINLIDPQREETRQFEVEHYHIHAKLNTEMPVGFLPPIMLLAEPVLTCAALYEAGKEYVEGHHLEFVYDQQGNTIGSKFPQPFLAAMQGKSRSTNVLNWKRVGNDDSQQD